LPLSQPFAHVAATANTVTATTTTVSLAAAAATNVLMQMSQFCHRCRHRFHRCRRRRRRRRLCFRRYSVIISLLLFAVVACTSRGQGPWWQEELVAWKGPLQRLDITILDDNLFNCVE
jgi:hypothetical protein